MAGSGSATTPEIDNMETDAAIASIIEVQTDDTIPPIHQTLDEHKDLKRKIDELENEDNQPNPDSRNPSHFDKGKPPKIQNTRRRRFYKPHNEGPFEVIVQCKDKSRINPFTVGKIIKSHFTNIKHITRSGKNLTVTCTNFETANDLLDSPHLLNYIVFIPANRVEVVGVVFVETNVTEKEMIEEGNSTYQIVQAKRITRYVNKEVIDTPYMKITFESEELPEYVYLNYVRLQVKPYLPPVKQCYNCFLYGHVAKAPCNRDKICRECGLNYHEGQCTTDSKKCVNCQGCHNSNDKSCPEYLRQKKIMERMTMFREDFFTASKHCSAHQSSNPYSLNRISYSDALRKTQNRSSANTPTINRDASSLSSNSYSNKFAPLDNDISLDIIPTEARTIPYNTKPKWPVTKHNTVFHSRPNPQVTPSTSTNSPPYIPLHSQSHPKPTMNTTATQSDGQTNTSQVDRSSLKKLLSDKINEIRNKIQGEKIINKQKVETILSQALKELMTETPAQTKSNINPKINSVLSGSNQTQQKIKKDARH